MALPENSSFINDSVDMDPYGYQEPFGAKLFKLILEVIIGLFGVIGNIFVCIVILKTAKLRSSTYYFICSLAIADIGVLLVCLPFAVIKQELVTDWPFGEGFCLYIYPATEIFFGASIWSITVIAIERYRIIVVNRPKIETRNSTKRRCAWMVIVAIWFGNFLLAGIPVYNVIQYYANDEMKVCYSDWSFGGKEPKEALHIAYMLALTIFWYIFPLGAISFTYFAISRKIKERAQFLARIGARNTCEMEAPENDRARLRHDDKSRMRKNAKAQRILTPLVLVFAVSMFPLNLFRIIMISWREFTELEYYWVLYDIMVFFTISNSASNPIIYTVVSNEFRAGFGSLMRFRQLQRCRDSHSDSGVTNTTTLSSIMKVVTPKSKRRHENGQCSLGSFKYKHGTDI